MLGLATPPMRPASCRAMAPEPLTDDPPAHLDEVRNLWPILSAEERIEAFEDLSREEAQELFEELSARSQAQILTGCPSRERGLWMRTLAPDDAADVLQELEPEVRETCLAFLDPSSKREVAALMAYAEDQAGGLMSPRFVRVRPDMTVEEAIRYLRRQAQDQHAETIYYVYVLGADQRLLGAVSFRELLTAAGERLVRDVMQTDLVTVSADQDEESVAKVVQQHDLLAVPVLDAEGRMQGIVTVDDVVDVVQQEATEDIHKLGGLQALEFPYLQTGLLSMLKKRGGWLALLFGGELLTASAMARFQDDIAKVVVLTLFVPLIISSGGNSGSQATTLVIRAMSLGEVRLRDWWAILRRELTTGLMLGGALALLGLLHVVIWEAAFGSYGEHALLVGTTVGLSLLLVVTIGTLSGAMLPMVLRRAGFDPASASAPFVATLVDVSGLVIYFSVAQWVLRGTLL